MNVFNVFEYFGTQSQDYLFISVYSFPGQMAVNIQGLSPRVQELHKKVKDFINEECYGLELLHRERLKETGHNRWTIMPEVEEAKVSGNYIVL